MKITELFFTITDHDTTFTNSKSKRFTTYDQALEAATERVENGTKAVIILKSVAVVYKPPTIVVESI